MALNFNSVEPTQIIAKDGSSEQTIAFPTGTKTVTVFQSSIDGSKQAVATFTSTHNFPANMVVCCDVDGKNNKTLTSTNQLISEQNDTKTSTTYLFYAKFSNNTLSLEQRVVYSFTGKAPQSVILRGRDYSATFYSATDLTVLKYSVTEKGLSGEATRASVSSYSKAALDGYVGLVNDTWGGITNASSLSKDKYYYIRVLVTDTNRYGKFCIRFKSYNGQTITTDNIGWGYDDEVIATVPVWGKPFSLTIQAGANSTVTVNRTSSPNQRASTGNITSGGIVYYGDTLTITATPASGYKLTSFKVNNTEIASESGETSATSQNWIVTGAVTIVTATQSAASWKTFWTGSLTAGFDTIHSEEYTTTNYINGITFAKQVPVRITGSFYVGHNTYGGGKPNRGTFTDKELTYNTGNYGNSYAQVELKESSAGQYQIYITCHTGGYMNIYVRGGLSQITITKIDVYW